MVDPYLLSPVDIGGAVFRPEDLAVSIVDPAMAVKGPDGRQPIPPLNVSLEKFFTGWIANQKPNPITPMPKELVLADLDSGKMYTLVGPFSVVQPDGTSVPVNTVAEFCWQLDEARYKQKSSVTPEPEGTFTVTMSFDRRIDETAEKTAALSPMSERLILPD